MAYLCYTVFLPREMRWHDKIATLVFFCFFAWRGVRAKARNTRWSRQIFDSFQVSCQHKKTTTSIVLLINLFIIICTLSSLRFSCVGRLFLTVAIRNMPFLSIGLLFPHANLPLMLSAEGSLHDIIFFIFRFSLNQS